MKKKNILTIVLVLLVVLLGGASVYVATQLSSRKAVAPTAPESKPKAAESCLSCPDNIEYVCGADEVEYTNSCIAECAGATVQCLGQCPCNWEGSDECTVTGFATEADCVPDGTVTCDPCPTACGTAASEVDCKDSCGVPTTNKVCEATEDCEIDEEEAVLMGSKAAFKNVTANTPGVYTLATEMGAVSKSQIYVYSITLVNTSEATATGVVIKDSLVDETNIVFMDAMAGCTWSAAVKELTCNSSINPDEAKIFNFRVKAVDGVANGEIISNTAKVTLNNGEGFDLTKDLTVSTVVGCNHTCTTDEECVSGLTCDTTTNKCRLAICSTEEDCTCGVVVTTTPYIPSVPKTTLTATPTKLATAAATPTTLPEAGILDLPGIAAFGGGLLLAVIGILLAL